MSANERGLGRGLDALFRNVTPAERPSSAKADSAEVPAPSVPKSTTTLPIAALTPCKGQPRKHFDEAALDELAASIREQGIIQPLLVRPLADRPGHYQIVAGERRWRAAQRAGLTEVPVYLRELSDEDALTAALIENLQREDLNPLEEAQAIQSLRERLPYSQEELAQRLGKSRSAGAGIGENSPDYAQGRRVHARPCPRRTGASRARSAGHPVQCGHDAPPVRT